MRGLMQDYPLTVQHMLWRSERLFAKKEIVTKREDGLHRYTYSDFAARLEFKLPPGGNLVTTRPRILALVRQII